MRQKRQNAILALISEKFIETQKELTTELMKMGYNVTQATISRDIRELRLVKSQTEDGRYRYVQSKVPGVPDGSSRIRVIFSNSVVSVDHALNIVVIKTLSGMAQPAAITIEAMDWPEVLGTIGGDDTVLVVVRDEKSASELALRLSKMLNGNG